MKKILSLLLMYAFIIPIISISVNANEADSYSIYVSTLGSKIAAGTIEEPVDSLKTALELAKEKDGAVNIYMRGGNYYMNEPAVIDSDFKYPINILAYANEEPILTGGRQIVGWKEVGNGIYGVYLRDFNYISNMIVNGYGAKRAYTENRIYSQGTYGEDTYFKQGIIINRADVPINFTGENSEIIFYYKWQDIHLKVDYAKVHPEDDTKLVLMLKQPEAPMQLFAWNQSINNNPFVIENDLTLLDTANEYYYDKDNFVLYYMPEEGVDMGTAKIYAGKKEELLIIEGTPDKKVADVAVKGLTFANTVWNKAELEGYTSAQTASYYDINNDASALKIANGIVPSAVRINWAENLSFNDNKFVNIGSAALGVYEAVSNSSINGNIFSDIGHSAVIMGLPSHLTASQQGKTNIAYKKPAWAGSTYLQFIAQTATDDDEMTFWSSNTASSDDCWLIVDLLGEYTISEVELTPRGEADYDNPDARCNFEIQASNSRDFSDYAVLAEQGAEDFGIDNVWSTQVSDTNKYRYIRVWKTDGAVMEIKHLRVYTTDLNGLAEKEVCKNNVISNNYVVRAANDIKSAAAIQLFCTNNCTITHNYLRDLPYTGISLGYGWDMENVTAYDNTVSYNRIENYMQTLYDGGGIYTLGTLPNLKVEYNYLKNARYGAGGLYPDEGTSGTVESPVVFTKNVVEDTPLWIQLWIDTIKNVNITANYTSNPYYVNDANDIVMSDNYAYIKTKEAEEVTAIKNNSGLESLYLHLVSDIPVTDFNGYETKEDYLRENAIVWNTTGTYKGSLLQGSIDTGDMYLDAIDGSGIDTDDNAEYAALEETVTNARLILLISNDYNEVFEARVNLNNALQAIIDSKIFRDIGVSFITVD